MIKKIKARRAVKHAHIKKDDQVVVLSGVEKGQKGKVLSVNPSKGTAIIEGVNMIQKHTKPNKNVGKGGIVEKEGPISLSNIGLLAGDGKSLTHAKIVKQGNEKNRVDVKSNEPLGNK